MMMGALRLLEGKWQRIRIARWIRVWLWGSLNDVWISPEWSWAAIIDSYAGRVTMMESFDLESQGRRSGKRFFTFSLGKIIFYLFHNFTLHWFCSLSHFSSSKYTGEKKYLFLLSSNERNPKTWKKEWERAVFTLDFGFLLYQYGGHGSRRKRKREESYMCHTLFHQEGRFFFSFFVSLFRSN